MHLIEYLQSINLRPYSTTSDFPKKLGITHQHVGDICRGLRRPSPDLAMKIEEVTQGQVTMKDLYEYYRQRQRDTETETVTQ